jgi:hypothetical protein
VPTLVIGGERSGLGLRDAADTVAGFPCAKKVILRDERYNVSAHVLAPVLVDFFALRDGASKTHGKTHG